MGTRNPSIYLSKKQPGYPRGTCSPNCFSNGFSVVFLPFFRVLRCFLWRHFLQQAQDYDPGFGAAGVGLGCKGFISPSFHKA